MKELPAASRPQAQSRFEKGDPSMTSWTTEELAKIGNAEELAIASRRPDGTPRPFVTIWVVSTGGDVYVRSIKGRSGTWLRRALAAGERPDPNWRSRA
jgi:hypothetical protein